MNAAPILNELPASPDLTPIGTAGVAFQPSEESFRLIWQQAGTTNITAWLMDGVRFISEVSLPALPDTNCGVVGTWDFNRDGKLDLVFTNSTNGVIIRLLDGSNITDVTLGSAPNSNSQVVGVDAYEGLPVIVWRNNSTGADWVWTVSGTNYAHTYTLEAETNLNWHIQAVGDFDRNGTPDAVWQNYSTGETRIWLMDNVTKIGVVTLPSRDDNWRIVGPK